MLAHLFTFLTYIYDPLYCSYAEKAEIVIQSQPFQLNPPLRVGEILLRNVKFSLCWSEIASKL